MPAVLPVSERVIDDRRRLGIHKLDERWAGVWHLVNPPKLWHGRLNSQMFLALAPVAEARGLTPYCDATGLFATPDDWRVPDQTYARADAATEAGLTAAELVVELRSPDDDTYGKLPFYARRAREVLVVHRGRRVELYRADGAGGIGRVPAGEGGALASEALGVAFATVATDDGPRLRIAGPEGVIAEV
jgi:Uma2 family endonuclease